MQVKRKNSALGAEITGIDLRSPLSVAQGSELRQALLDHGVIFVRGQYLDSKQFVGFARAFGEIEMYDSTLRKYLLSKQPEVIVLSNIVEDGKPIGVADAGAYWHTDRSYVRKPAWASCLYAIEVPYGADGTPLGDTEFASMTAACQALDTADRERLGSLCAWHEYVFRFSERNDSMPGVRHPVILKHPVTAAPCLYVNRGFTHRILDVPERDGQELLERLFEHATRPEFLYRHQWRVGDLLLWDNYSTQHRATGGYSLPQRRLMWRTTIEGFALH